MVPRRERLVCMAITIVMAGCIGPGPISASEGEASSSVGCLTHVLQSLVFG
jgi:hypothetical protein